MSDTGAEEEHGKVIGLLTNTFDPWLESKRASNTMIIVFVIVIALLALGVGLLTTRTILPLDQLHISLPSLPIGNSAASSHQDSTLFTCAQGRSVDAAFSTGLVDLTLSDSRSLTLPEVSAGRYANPDGSFVFDTTGATASIKERGVETYKNCQS